MYIHTDGIIIKQVKMPDDRKMLILFSKTLGKISVATNNQYPTKSKSNMAMQSFNYGKYVLYKIKDYYYFNQGDIIKSYYRIGEDIEKYACAAYVFELTDANLIEGKSEAKIFDLLLSFLDVIEKRKKEHILLVRAYEIKLLTYNGIMPSLNECVRCGNTNTNEFSISNGGLICEDCKEKDELILKLDNNIIKVIKYLENNSLKALENLTLDKNTLEKLNYFMNLYLENYMGTNNMKSKMFLKTLIDNERR